MPFSSATRSAIGASGSSTTRTAHPTDSSSPAITPSCVMLGPGVAHDEATALALLWRALDALRGHSVVFLVPCSARRIVQTCYAWGARNVELHAAQTTGPAPVARGIALPTFLPESG